MTTLNKKAWVLYLCYLKRLLIMMIFEYHKLHGLLLFPILFMTVTRRVCLDFIGFYAILFSALETRFLAFLYKRPLTRGLSTV